MGTGLEDSRCNRSCVGSDPSYPKLVIFNNCGHVPQEECPGQFIETLVNFIKGVQND
jgi:pimeloyl-ACP methyl ester carboxylesterase